MKAEPGIRQTRSGWQAYVRVRGEFRSQHFPPDTKITTLRQWRETEIGKRQAFRAAAKRGLEVRDPDAERSLGRDADRYLSLVGYLVSFKDRQRRLREWVTLLGRDTPRASITAVDIRLGLERLRLKRGLKPKTLNLYRTDLIHLWRLLDGKSATNPALDVPAYKTETIRWRLPTWAAAEKAIAAVVSKRSQARLSVMLWTGLPQAQLKRLAPADVQFRAKQVYVAGRKKGAGTANVTLPLLPQAVQAFAAFREAKAWGSFSNRSLAKTLQHACRRAKVKRFHPYLLRHLFLTEVAKAIGDDRVVAALGLHADTKMTQRYTEQSVDLRLKKGLEMFRQTRK